jgi:quercetin dioxygenase-like cupin family protein
VVIRHLSEIPKETPAMPGTKAVTLQWLITKKDGAPHYAMRIFTIAPGGEIPLHNHADAEHEMFVVEGEAVLKSSGADQVVRAGDALLVLTGDRHGFLNASDKPFRFICVIPV